MLSRPPSTPRTSLDVNGRPSHRAHDTVKPLYCELREKCHAKVEREEGREGGLPYISGGGVGV